MPKIKELDSLTLPLSLSLHSDNYNFTYDNNATFPDYNNTGDGHEIELIISEYFVDNLLFILHKEGYINL